MEMSFLICLTVLVIHVVRKQIEIQEVKIYSVCTILITTSFVSVSKIGVRQLVRTSLQTV